MSRRFQSPLFSSKHTPASYRAPSPFTRGRVKVARELGEGARLVRDESRRILDEFVAADIVVLGVPMYNWGIPTQLKSWVDITVVSGGTLDAVEQLTT